MPHCPPWDNRWFSPESAACSNARMNRRLTDHVLRLVLVLVLLIVIGFVIVIEAR